MNKISNSSLYPEAWKLFIEHARNVESLRLGHLYEIPHPNISGDIIKANSPQSLFKLFNEAHILETNVAMKLRKHIDWNANIEAIQAVEQELAKEEGI